MAEKKTVSFMETLRYPADQVWSAVGDFAKPQHWHWAFEECYIVDEGEGVFRRLTTVDGREFSQQLTVCDEDRRAIGWMQLSGADSVMCEIIETTLTITDAGEGQCNLEWRADYVPINCSVESHVASLLGDNIVASVASLTRYLATMSPNHSGVDS